ncbi:MAG: hypothetical protein M3024_03860 [Candidatus Dormibacteraeota bacterium]|nr:hypothetical protein [Candidatus Dormibacteraeota bacterium]
MRNRGGAARLAGDPATLDSAAQTWRTLAAALEAGERELDQEAAKLLSSCEGEASNAFQAHSSKTADPQLAAPTQA